jgi:hypothetical protein
VSTKRRGGALFGPTYGDLVAPATRFSAQIAGAHVRKHLTKWARALAHEAVQYVAPSLAALQVKPVGHLSVPEQVREQ